MDWSRSAQEIHDQIRGLMAWPRASTDVLGGEAVKLYRSQVLAEKRSGTAGTVLGGGKARHRCAVRRWQGTSHYRASGAWIPADVCRRLSPGAPLGN